MWCHKLKSFASISFKKIQSCNLNVYLHLLHSVTQHQFNALETKNALETIILKLILKKIKKKRLNFIFFVAVFFLKMMLFKS